ncbi:hypothetical protein [Alteriqipengyuania lutimaris]|uniref:hypothetical protein n=1 Tax=Alteriqipengyuania lutimaris TaxID=1538146 RepID=UPI0015F186F8|nr:hypothetical protein [Alteriqipengyuania lutimaris]MBB3034137.1 hypothetical protein [Alteriqipengyuania lutimaris]
MVKVDNAYDSNNWGKERLLVNDEVVKESCGKDRTQQIFEEPWLTPDGEVEFTVKLKSGFFSVGCYAVIGEKEVSADKYFEAMWFSEGDAWPEEDAWLEKAVPGSATEKPVGLLPRLLKAITSKKGW